MTTAQARTAWALRHRRRFALMASGDVLASAERYDLTGSLDGQLVKIWDRSHGAP